MKGRYQSFARIEQRSGTVCSFGRHQHLALTRESRHYCQNGAPRRYNIIQHRDMRWDKHSATGTPGVMSGGVVTDTKYPDAADSCTPRLCNAVRTPEAQHDRRHVKSQVAYTFTCRLHIYMYTPDIPPPPPPRAPAARVGRIETA